MTAIVSQRAPTTTTRIQARFPDSAVFHVSESSDIVRFDPRDGRVWAINAARLHNYLLPRDCPRVTFYATPDTTTADRNRFLGTGAGPAAGVVAIESVWETRARTTPLYVYHLDAEAFSAHDVVAGYVTCADSVTPIGMSTVDVPLDEIARRGAHVRVLPELWRLREAVAASTLGFSIIRMRNAQPMPAGFTTDFEVAR